MARNQRHTQKGAGNWILARFSSTLSAGSARSSSRYSTASAPTSSAFREGSEANSIAWLVWHLTRVQDDHVCDVAGREQAWVAEGWAERFGLDLDVRDTGYGHNPDQVAVVKASAELLSDYHDAVFQSTVRLLERVCPPATSTASSTGVGTHP